MNINEEEFNLLESLEDIVGQLQIGNSLMRKILMQFNKDLKEYN